MTQPGGSHDEGVLVVRVHQDILGHQRLPSSPTRGPHRRRRREGHVAAHAFDVLNRLLLWELGKIIACRTHRESSSERESRTTSDTEICPGLNLEVAE
jgi:hypothetical protein